MASSTRTSLKSERSQPSSAAGLVSRKRFSWMGLRGRLTLMAVIMAIAPVLSVGALAYWLTGQAIARRTAQDRLTQTHLAAATLQSVLEARYQVATEIAALDLFTDPALRQVTTQAQQKHVLNTFQQRLGGAESIAFLDSRGQILFQADSTQPLSGDLGSQEFVQRALKTRQATMSQLALVEGSNSLTVDFAAPIIDLASNQLVGLIYLQVPGQDLQSALETLDGENINWYLLNAEVQVIGSSDAARMGQSAEPLWSQLPDHLTAQQPGSGIEPQPNGGRALLTYAPLPLSEDMPRQTLGMLLLSDTASALAPSTLLLRILLLGTGVMTLLAARLAVAMSQRLVQPIQQASEAVDLMVQGNFNVNLETNGSDELGELGRRLNYLGEQLYQQMTSLHQKHARELQQQQELWNQERQRLQTDVLQIKQVLATLESGDWTTQAAISDLPTAQVATNLNRVIEALGEVLRHMLNRAELVNLQVRALGTAAATTAKNALQQQQMVMETRTTVVEVETLSQNAQKQALTTGKTLEHTQVTLSQGSQDLETLSTSLSTLQQGTNQIVQRTQTLAEFVDLVAQFPKEQKRVASQTRVLALNASMLASRATGQQDPSQFASVAHEFETIAQQINDLAVEANQNLILLKQRSDQIQTVVSGLEQDVQTINEMVGGVASGVGQFQGTFENLDHVSDQTLQLVQHLTESSRAITTATKAAIANIQSLEAISVDTHKLAQLTQDEATQTDIAAGTLQQQIQFFQLNSANEEELHRTLPATAGSDSA